MNRLLSRDDDTITTAIHGLQTASLPQRQRKIHYLIDHYEDACHTDEFARYMDESSLEQILSSDEVHANERTIFNSVMAWARTQLELKSTDVTPPNMRTQLQRIIPHIRFPTMDFDELSGVVKDSDILTAEELVDCFVYKGAKAALNPHSPLPPDQLPTSRFTTRARVGVYLSMERKRAAYKRRQQLSLKWQRIFHLTQFPMFVCMVPSLLFLFLILIGAYQDHASGGITWWLAYLPMWIIVAFVIINLSAIIYFYRRDHAAVQPDNRSLWLFVGVFDHEQGPFKHMVHAVENNRFGQRWVATLVTGALLFLILVGMYQSPSTSLPPWIVYAPIFIVMFTLLAMPLVGNGNIQNKLQPCAAACCLVWLPILIMLILSLHRQYAPTSMPLWAVFIPLWIFFCCGGCVSFGVCVISLLNRRNASDLVPGVIGCLVLVPLALTAIFLSIRASAIDHDNKDLWQPHLLTSLSPMIMIVGIGAIVACIGAVMGTRSMPTIHPTPLPLDLREHTDPPPDAMLPNHRPSPSSIGITIAQ